MSGWEDAGGVGVTRRGDGAHGAEFPDGKFAVLDAGADLAEEERAGGLEAMENPNEED